MTLQFHAPQPWTQIQKYSAKQKSWVAVPFLGKDAAKFLPIPKGSILVTRFNRESIKAGQVDPSEVLKFIKRGVQVYNYGSLHSKVYVLGRRLFVGSSNVSKTSQGLSEACIETTDPKLIGDARLYVKGLCGDLITEEFVKSLISLYPKENSWFFGAPSLDAKKKISNRSSVWIATVGTIDWSDEVVAVDKVAAVKAKASISDQGKFKLDKTAWDRACKFAVGDLISWRWSKGRGFEFECHVRVIQIEDVKETGEKIIYAEKAKGARNISSVLVRKELNRVNTTILFKSHGAKKLASEKVAVDFLKLWSQFRGD